MIRCDTCDGTGRVTLDRDHFDEGRKRVYDANTPSPCPDCEGGMRPERVDLVRQAIRLCNAEQWQSFAAALEAVCATIARHELRSPEYYSLIGILDGEPPVTERVKQAQRAASAETDRKRRAAA